MQPICGYLHPFRVELSRSNREWVLPYESLRYLRPFKQNFFRESGLARHFSPAAAWPLRTAAVILVGLFFATSLA